ncbi:hypothetical protein L484_016601 [Morus notabilis]|uniref:Uncharacterized protein n=1 Tax=Morus notabilis TaxID=981085 RepID=W9QKZ1_9ROSA|nr:hypothetical protein L484_016601 [Morus notabilis]
MKIGLRAHLVEGSSMVVAVCHGVAWLRWIKLHLELKIGCLGGVFQHRRCWVAGSLQRFYPGSGGLLLAGVALSPVVGGNGEGESFAAACMISFSFLTAAVCSCNLGPSLSFYLEDSCTAKDSIRSLLSNLIFLETVGFQFS